MDGGELQDATKLSNSGRRLTVERDVFIIASRLTGDNDYSELLLFQTKILAGIQMFCNVPLSSNILSWHDIHLQSDQGQTSESFECAARGLTISQHLLSRVQRINISACQGTVLNHLSHFVAVWAAHHSLLL